VLISGWKTYDDKGRVVESGEPYFATGWDYAAPTPAQRRVRVEQHYDARGTLVRTVRADGSQRLVVPGIPAALDDPAAVAPTPWATTVHDENDNAQRDHPVSPGDAVHWDTPATTVVDPLGRVATVVERLRERRADGSFSAIREIRTERTYDARGNLATLRDPLGRFALRRLHSHTDRPLRDERLDGGTTLTAYDAAGQEVERRDDRGAQQILGRDDAGRLIRVWARATQDEPLILRERLTHGSLADRTGNRAGRIDTRFDEAGAVGFAYDPRGAVRETRRSIVAAGHVADAVADAAADEWRLRPFRTDWTQPRPRASKNAPLSCSIRGSATSRRSAATRSAGCAS
jgi:YD repeat-containing protein